MKNVTIIGDGAMATVCAQVLAARPDLRVTMWGRNAGRLRELGELRENRRYLPGVKLGDGLQFEADDAKAFAAAELVICAVPAQFIRGALERLKPAILNAVPVVSVAKGIEVDTLRRPTEVVREVLGERLVAALSGPNIAGELARRLPATMVVAAGGKDERQKTKGESEAVEDFAREVQKLFTTPYLRVYRNGDLLGVELAGALKNVIAMAAGMLDGMRSGNNAKAALLTRGLVEITRLAVAMGAKAETFMGLAGLGDLVTTCVSPEGRNRSFGERVGKGEKVDEVLRSMVGVVEGVATCKSVVAMSRALGIEMPISAGLFAVLFEGRNPAAQLADLMMRESKREA